jgi:hypothetical protein
MTVGETTTSVDLNVSDAELFNDAMADEAPVNDTPEQQAETQESQPQEQPRDPATGRFTTSEPPAEGEPAQAQEQPQQQAAQEPEKQYERIPLPEYLSTRERAQRAEARAEALERQLAQMSRAAQQPKQEPAAPQRPDPLIDPEGYATWVENTMAERLLHQQRDFDLRMAHSRHGKVFEEAYAAAQSALASGDTHLRALMMNATSPGEALVNWHRQQQVVRETGGDLGAYRQKTLEEALKDPAFLAKALEAARATASTTTAQGGTQGKPNISLPPSLTRATSAGGHISDPSENDVSDAALFEYATRN